MSTNGNDDTAAVDREALAEAVRTYHAEVDRANNRQWSGSGAPIAILAGATLAKAVDAVLAARGDAAPTEVEWGVRWSENTTEAFRSEEEARAAMSDQLGDVLVQRTVSPWREVER